MSHATPGELCTDLCHHVCGPCTRDRGEPCADFINLPNGPMVACQADDEPTSPIDWDDVEHWGGRVHVGTTDDLGDHRRHTDETEES